MNLGVIMKLLLCDLEDMHSNPVTCGGKVCIYPPHIPLDVNTTVVPNSLTIITLILQFPLIFVLKKLNWEKITIYTRGLKM